eukprot:Gb_04497 [translate_table: standard]
MWAGANIGFESVRAVVSEVKGSNLDRLKMNSQEQQEKAPRRELQGPRPTPLKISRDSHKIRKPPLPVPEIQYRQPVIIYTQSPKVIHTEAGDFRTLVQRLTGRSHHQNDTQMAGFDLRQRHDVPMSSAHFNPQFSVSPEIAFNPNSESSELLHVGTRSEEVMTNSAVSDHQYDNNMHAKEELVHAGSIPANPSGPFRSPYFAGMPLISPSPSGLPPLSPNFFLPSPPFLSPSIFQDFPLFTPNADFFSSPRNLLYRASPIFTPNRPPMSGFSSIPSPSPTGFDLFNNHREY